MKKKENEFDCLKVGAICEECPYGRKYKDEKGKVSNYTCSPIKLKKHGIKKVGIGISMTNEEWEEYKLTHWVD